MRGGTTSPFRSAKGARASEAMLAGYARERGRGSPAMRGNVRGRPISRYGDKGARMSGRFPPLCEGMSGAGPYPDTETKGRE